MSHALKFPQKVAISTFRIFGHNLPTISIQNDHIQHSYKNLSYLDLYPSYLVDSISETEYFSQ